MSMAAVPGTGPSTGPISVIRRTTSKATFEDLPTNRTLVMGILNVTDNSFSDGGEYASVEDAINHGLRMHYGGADIIDVGGESTAPGNAEVSAEEEKSRIIPVVEALIKAGAFVSLDTRHAETARACLELGQVMINDVSGLSVEDDMPKLVAESGAKYVVMHNRGNSITMDSRTDYADVVADVVAETQNIIQKFLDAGVKEDQIIVDPGLGFSKCGDQNWELLKNLKSFVDLGYPVLVGASRKRFLGDLLAGKDKPAKAPKDRDDATAAISALAAVAGAWAVRVHDVEPNLDAVKTAAAWTNGAVQK